MTGERGSALVQVLVMSVLLTVLATGVMKVMFMNHVVVGKVQTSEQLRDFAERCLAMKTAAWQGSPCGGGSSDSCNFGGGVSVNITCVDNVPAQSDVNAKKVTISVVVP